MRRFEFSEGNSNKFWEIDYSGADSFTVRWGRLGTDGQTQTKAFATEVQARAAAEKLIAEKVGKGYTEVGACEASAPRAGAARGAQAGAAAPAPHDAASSGGSTAMLLAPPAPATFVWTEALRKKIHPWRGMQGPIPKPSADLKKPVARLVEVAALPAVELQKKAARKGAAVKARAGAAPDQLADDPQVEAIYAAMLGFNDGMWRRANEIGADLVTLWCARSGVNFALQTLLELFPLNDQGDVAEKLVGGAPMPAAWHVLRSHLAAASQEDYDRAVEAAKEPARSGHPALRMMLAYAFPDQTWSEGAAQEVLASGASWQSGCALLASVLDVDLARQLAKRYESYVASDWVEADAGHYLPALVDRLGEAAVGPLAVFLAADVKSAAKRTVCQMLSVVASRASAEVLLGVWKDKAVAPQVTAYFSTQPYLAALLLTPRACATRDEGVISCLTAALAHDPREAMRALPELEPPARAWLETTAAALGHTVGSGSGAVPGGVAQGAVRPDGSSGIEGPAESAPAGGAKRPATAGAENGELPPILAAPPWTRPKPQTKPAVVPSLSVPEYPETVVWRPNERKPGGWRPGRFTAQREAEILSELRRSAGYLYPENLLDMRDREGALKAWNELPVATWNIYSLASSSGNSTLQLGLLAQYGAEALPGLLRSLTAAPANTYEALTRVDSPRVATIWAEALAGKKYRRQAQQWLNDFPRAAVFGLLPAALGPAGKTRIVAENALRWAARAHREAVLAAADEAGQRASMTQLLDTDPLLNLPARLPAVPAWFTPATLSRPVLKSGLTVPLESLETIAVMLALSSLEEPYAGLDELREACEPRSLADFAWDVFSAWVRAGGPAKEDWGFLVLGYLGGDEAARRLAPELRKWPGESLSARAQRGLDVLGAIGTDIALMHLHGISQKVKYKALQDKAKQKIEEIAEARGLTVDELADRLVPDLDLDENGTRELSFGPRSFRVGFNEVLKPFVLDPAGKRLPDLPKPGKDDDAQKAAESTEVWKALKKDAKTVATLQLDRLEQCMTRRRRWDAPTWTLFLKDHPLLKHLVRRLVWGTATATFRVAEDGTLADAHDDSFELLETDVVGLVHPLETDLKPWVQVLVEYELTQPFPQLFRTVHFPAPEDSQEIVRVKGRKYSGGRLLKLEARGWHRGEVDSGCILDFVKPLAEGRSAVLEISDGIWVGEPNRDDNELRKLAIRGGRISDLHPVEFSEIIQDIEGL